MAKKVDKYLEEAVNNIIKDREGKWNVGFYKPYVCKVYLKRYNLPIPPQLQYVKE